jgi:hypothetical protein
MLLFDKSFAVLLGNKRLLYWLHFEKLDQFAIVYVAVNFKFSIS